MTDQVPTTVATADQPSFHFSNILAHPGSTAAGVAIVMALASYLQKNPVPDTLSGWVLLAASVLSAFGAALGK